MVTSDRPSDSEFETQALMVARVSDVAAPAPPRLSADRSLRDAALAMRSRNSGCVLVDGAEGVGIVTGTDLRDALALDGVAPEAPLGPLARRPLIEVDGGDSLLEALMRMQRARVKRLIVREGEAIVGVLDQADVLGFFAGQTNAVLLVARQADRPAQLKPAFDGALRLIAALYRIGMRPERLARLSSEVNRAIFRRVFELVFPAALQQAVCLAVMGSEGRAEQVLPTDQDNALIVRDGVDPGALREPCARFSAELIGLGYPPCPGGIMVSNPYWVLDESGFRARIRDWIFGADSEDVMNLAIFFDAAAVAGDPALLAHIKGHLFDLLETSDAFYARFASAVDAFPVPVGMFSRLVVERSGEHAGMLDLKKGGIFPIVHGVRSLALHRRLAATGTIERIGTLTRDGVIDSRLSRDLVEAFEFLTHLRVERGVAALSRGEGIESIDNRIRPSDLNLLDQERLRDSLRVVMRLRETVRHYFRLDLLGF